MIAEHLVAPDRPFAESLYETEISSEHLPENYCITRAIPNDIDAILAMRERIADKLWKNPATGDQWRQPWPDDVGQMERILESIKAGETYMVWGGKEGVDLVGTFAVSVKGDSRLWTPEEQGDDNALYLSRLMAAEKGIGNGIIQTVRDWGKDQEKEYIRIDVWDTNKDLLDYYAQPERGFQLVRQDPIDGYPSCALMQATTNRHTPLSVVKSEIQLQNSHMLKLPERVIWERNYNDLGVGPNGNTDDSWRIRYEKWEQNGKDSRHFYCPRLDEGWFFDEHGHTVGSLRFSSFLSSKQYSDLSATIGLRETLISFNSQYEKLSVDGHRNPIRDYRTYKEHEENPASLLPLLLEGYMDSDASVQLKGGKVSLLYLERRAFRLPTGKENGLQPTSLFPGDHVHVRMSPDGTSADILKLTNGEESNETQERAEFMIRTLTNDIYTALKLEETSQVYDLVQQFYSIESTGFEHEEKLLRKTLQRNGIYAVEQSMVKLELAESRYNGFPIRQVRELLVMEIEDGTIEDLRRCMTYFRTFKSSPEDYSALAEAIWKKAEEFGCERDVMRTMYASMVREASPQKRISAATFKAFLALAFKFGDIKDPLPVNRARDEV